MPFVKIFWQNAFHIPFVHLCTFYTSPGTQRGKIVTSMVYIGSALMFRGKNEQNCTMSTKIWRKWLRLSVMNIFKLAYTLPHSFKHDFVIYIDRIGAGSLHVWRKFKRGYCFWDFNKKKIQKHRDMLEMASVGWIMIEQRDFNHVILFYSLMKSIYWWVAASGKVLCGAFQSEQPVLFAAKMPKSLNSTSNVTWVRI